MYCVFFSGFNWWDDWNFWFVCSWAQFVFLIFIKYFVAVQKLGNRTGRHRHAIQSGNKQHSGLSEHEHTIQTGQARFSEWCFGMTWSVVHIPQRLLWYFDEILARIYLFRQLVNVSNLLRKCVKYPLGMSTIGWQNIQWKLKRQIRLKSKQTKNFILLCQM